MSEPHEARARIGYMSHAPMLYDELTAEENLRYFRTLYPGRDASSPADALRQVGLDPDLKRHCRPIFAGNAAAHLARPRAASLPDLLLLDEPFSNMDVESVRQMVELLARFRQSDRTIVITTHQRELAAPIADWVITLHAGRVASLDSRSPDAHEDQRRALPRVAQYPLRASRIRGRSEDDLSAITVASKIGMPAEQVFKTLLTTDGAHDCVFAVIPGDADSTSRNSLALAGWRKAEMAPLKDVQPLTGYIRGGVTIFGAKKPYPVFIDETAILFDRISVSAGTRGTQLILTPDDYLRAAAALGDPVQTADLTKETHGAFAGPREMHA